MPSTIFSGSKVKTLKSTLSLNGGADVISSTVDPTSVAVDASPGSILLNTTSGKQYRKNDSGSSTNWTEVGAGTSGINYITNPTASTNTTGWSTYADAAGAAPVDGSGGSPTVTWTRSTTTPLRGAADFNFTKDAANRQGEGVATDITIDLADRAKVLTVSFDYEVLSGTYASGDLTVYLIADPSGTPVVIQPAGYTVQSATVGTTMRQIATFQTQATGQSYRVCFHVASTSASAYVLAIDNVICGPQTTVYGAPVTDWQSYTTTVSNLGAGSSTNSARYRRVGDEIEFWVQITKDATPGSGASAVNFTLPSGFSADTSKIPSSSEGIGIANLDTATFNLQGPVFTLTPTTIAARKTGTAGNITGADLSANSILVVRGSVPIAGLSSSVQMSNDTDTRVVAASGYNASSTTVTITATATKITTFGQAVQDTHGAWSTANQEYTIPVSGYYSIFFSLYSDAVAANVQMSAFIYAGATQIAEGTERNFYTLASSCNPQTTVIKYLAAGTVITFRGAVNTGTALAGSYTPSAFSIQRLSGPATIAASETVATKAIFNVGTGQVVASATSPTVVFTAKEIDTHNAYNTSTGVWTCPVSGKYQINHFWRTNAFSPAVGTAFASTIAKNGSSKSTYYWDSTNSSFTRIPNGGSSTMLSLVAGDQISMLVSNSLGASITLADQSGANGIVYTYLEIFKIGSV